MFYEVAWTRLLSMIFGTSTYAFSLILATFLTGLSLGSLVAGFLSDRYPHQLRVMIAIALFGAAFSASLTLGALNSFPYVFAKFYLLANNQFAFFSENQIAFFIRFVLAFMMMFPATFFLGGLFPLIVRHNTSSPQSASQIVANTYVFNTIGSVLGSLTAGFGIGPLLGLYSGTYLASALLLAIGASVLWKLPLNWQRKLALSALGIALGGCLIISNPQYDPRLLFLEIFQYPHRAQKATNIQDFEKHLLERTNVHFYKDGISATVVVAQFEETFSLLTDGKGDAASSAELAVRKSLAHLPLIFAQHPQKVLVIGLGGGTTAASALKHPIQQLNVVEIEANVAEAFKQYFSTFHPELLSDPRTQLIIDDAKNHIQNSPNTYDVIISQSSHPWRTGSSRLFTQEFWQQARSKLSEEGIFAQWIQLYNLNPEQFKSLTHTYQRVFPYLLMFRFGQDGILLGKKTPWVIDLKQYQSRVSQTTVQQDLYRMREPHLYNYLPYDLLAHFELGSSELAELSLGGRLNTEDFPFIEFSAPLTLLNSKKNGIYDLLNQHSPRLVDHLVLEQLSKAEQHKFFEGFARSINKYQPQKRHVFLDQLKAAMP